MTAKPILPEHFQLLSFDEIDSTNEEAKRQAAVGAPDGTVVWAKRQSAGKGRRSRAWVSEEGNLYCSLLVRPDVLPPEAMQMSFVAANAVAETVAASLPRGTFVTCKWPNDVLVEGKKTAGILLESGGLTGKKLDWLVVGTGINLNSFPEDAAFPATSLHREGAAKDVTVEGLLVSYYRRFLASLVTWRNIGFAATRRAWLERAYGLGKPLTVRLDKENLEGVFETLDEDGALILRQGEVFRRITTGDVFPHEG
ncbi:MAG: biotin--[acetyl-CoA-carboxylase] ligase [Rhodospirillales bacterium]|nr:biotin--[acetyl-CoA-carboxylase] ligase [Rhodospirillales bacterium]